MEGAKAYASVFPSFWHLIRSIVGMQTNEYDNVIDGNAAKNDRNRWNLMHWSRIRTPSGPNTFIVSS